VSTPPAHPRLSLGDLVQDFTLRLRALVEVNIRERGEEIIASIFAAVQAGPASRLARREMKAAARERRRLITSLTRRFLYAIEQATQSCVRKALAREWAKRAKATARAAAAQRPVAPASARRRTRRRPLPPPPDPEQLKRDAEFARLRVLLRPAAEGLPQPAPFPAAPVVQPQRPAKPGEFLRALENEIQDAVPSLGALGPERCGARIAAWAGQVRELRDRLAPEILAAMRPAIRIFLEHLTELRAAMDAHFVDALEPEWSVPDWSVYIEANRACAEGRPSRLSPDELETYHRSMLRALVQPHRRNVPNQATPVIDAAAAFLPADDGQLRAAIRRHSPEWRAKTRREAEVPLDLLVADEVRAEEPLGGEPRGDEFASDALPADPLVVASESIAESPPPDPDTSRPAASERTAPSTGPAGPGEFDQSSTK
jgi:hypothetical protein